MYVCMYVYKYSVDIYLLCMIKVRVRWCTFSLCENVITLCKLIGLLILFCHPLHSILFLKTPKIRGMTLLAQQWEPFFF